MINHQLLSGYRKEYNQTGFGYHKNMITIKKASLNVSDLEKLTTFYNDVVGLEIISQNTEQSLLGVDGEILLQLIQVDTSRNPKEAGLYHIAYLLPTKKAMGEKIKDFIDRQIELTGAADHGYSGALYLDDPEGNGIEIYYDKPVSEWDILVDGQIVGVTEPLDVQDLLEEVTTSSKMFPKETTIGHIHLSVLNLDETYRFYHDLLQLDLKYKFGEQAMFFASGLYHHHIGANTWDPRRDRQNSRQYLGLVGFELEVDEKTYSQHANRLIDNSGNLITLKRRSS